MRATANGRRTATDTASLFVFPRLTIHRSRPPPPPPPPHPQTKRKQGEISGPSSARGISFAAPWGGKRRPPPLPKTKQKNRRRPEKMRRTKNGDNEATVALAVAARARPPLTRSFSLEQTRPFHLITLDKACRELSCAPGKACSGRFEDAAGEAEGGAISPLRCWRGRRSFARVFFLSCQVFRPSKDADDPL